MNGWDALKQILQSYTAPQAELRPDSRLADLGLDSYAVVDLVVRVEQTFDIAVDDDCILRLETLQDIIDLLPEQEQPA